MALIGLNILVYLAELAFGRSASCTNQWIYTTAHCSEADAYDGMQHPRRPGQATIPPV